jgi:HAMP domain-containing protein
MSRLSKVSVAVFALISAITLALLSVFVERASPELVRYGDSDFRPVLKGGFPLAYLFDMPGVSVQGKLSFGEDILSVGALVFDIAIYFAIILLITEALSRRSRARKKTESGAGT